MAINNDNDLPKIESCKVAILGLGYVGLKLAITIVKKNKNYIPINNHNLNFHKDLEINHWIEQWYLTYRDAFQALKNKRNVHFISYEKLCSSEDYWYQIQEIAKIKECYNFEFKESKKDIKGNINAGLKEKVVSLYLKLNCLNLN